MRILIVTEIPAPFRIPLFNALAERPDVDLTVCFLAERDPRRTHYRVYRDEFAFGEVVLPGIGLRRGARWLMVNRGMLGLLRRSRPDAVLVGGWNQPAFWQVLGACRATRKPAFLWVESTGADARIKNSAADAFRRLALRTASGFVVPGRAARAYLRGFGVPADRIVEAPNAVDLTIFTERVDAMRADRDAVRSRLGLNGCVFAYVGRLERAKGVEVLVRAMRDVPAQLVLIGSGSLDSELQHADGDRVRVVGMLARDELVPWYAAVDGLVLPTRSDTWGMVLNEGAAAGLPLVATEAAGAAHDLIEPGQNGFRVPVDDAQALGDALRTLAADESLRRAFGERSRQLSERFRPEAWAAAVADFAATTAGARSEGRRTAG